MYNSYSFIEEYLEIRKFCGSGRNKYSGSLVMARGHEEALEASFSSAGSCAGVSRSLTMNPTSWMKMRKNSHLAASGKPPF